MLIYGCSQRYVFLDSMKSHLNCFQDTRFFIPLTSSEFGSLCREIVFHGGMVVPDPTVADICVAPDDSGIRREGWYSSNLITDSVQAGAVPCLCRYDSLTGFIPELKSFFFEGLEFFYPFTAPDYYDIRKIIQTHGGKLSNEIEGTILLLPNGWKLFGTIPCVSIEFIHHCVRLGKLDCFCGFEV